MTNVERSPREVIGANVRHYRERAGATQEALAAAARQAGLSWGRSKVAALERGDKPIDVAELVLLAELLGEVTGTPITLADLFAGNGAIRLSRGQTLTPKAMRRFLTGDPVTFRVRDVPGGTEEAAAIVAAGLRQLKRAAELAPGVTAAQARHAEHAAGEVEERAGRALGLSRVEVAYLSVGLWGRTLGEERDARVGDEPDPARRRGRRGQVTRTLIVELQQRLAEVGQHGKH